MESTQLYELESFVIMLQMMNLTIMTIPHCIFNVYNATMRNLFTTMRIMMCHAGFHAETQSPVGLLPKG